MESHKKLGETLLGLGVIDPVKLNAALQAQKAYGGRLGSHLASMGFLSEEKLVDVLAHQLKIPKINLRHSHIRIDALSMVKKEICRKYCLIPVAKKVKGSVSHLLIAMADPTDIEAIDTVDFAGNCRVTVAIATEKDINKAIECCYTDKGLKECVGEEDLQTGISLNLNMDEHEHFEIITADDSNVSPLSRHNVDPLVRSLIELLVRKKVISYDEAIDLVKSHG